MPRPERELDPTDGPIAALAARLRELRRHAGNPGYRTLASRTGYSTTTLSEAAGGRRLPALPVVLAYVAACGGVTDDWARAWREVAEALAQDRGSGTGESAPYLGLASFQPEDRDRFFGRERLIRDLLGRLSSARLVGVFGASGSGKSSLLRAGVVAELSKPSPGAPAHAVVLTPTEDPLAAWQRTAALGGARADQLIVVDQLEELFTLCNAADQRRLFVERLLGAVDGGARVLLGARADFYARCAELPGLVEALAGQTVLLGPMNDEELKSAITGPASRVGLTVERALVTQLLADAQGQPGALPLVSHALLETWRQRQGTTLTLAGYLATGGVRGAIAQTAERLYERLGPEQQRVVREILVRLTALGEGTGDTRRPVSRRELDFQGAVEILEQLAAARLVVLAGDRVEVAHEALIAAWPRLRGWLTEDREALRTHRALTEAAATWETLGRDAGALYRGARLAIAREWAQRRDQAALLTLAERGFLDASIAAELAERSSTERRARLLKRLTVALSCLVGVTLSAGAFATWQWRAAVLARLRAESRQLAGQALAAAESDVATGLRLAIDAYQRAATLESRSALFTLASRPAYTGRLVHGGMVKDVAFSQDGSMLATGDQDGRVVLWDRPSRRERAVLRGHRGAARAVTFTPDGRYLVSGGLDASVIVWDIGTRAEVVRLGGHRGRVDSVAVSPDGRTVAAAGVDRHVRLWRLPDGGAVGELGGDDGGHSEVAFSPDGRLLVSAGGDGAVVLWEVATGRRRRTLRAEGALFAAAFSPDGRLVAAAGEERDITVWDVATGERRARLRGHSGAVQGIAFAQEDAVLVSAAFDTRVVIWDVQRGRRLANLIAPASGLYAIAVSPDGGTVAGASRDHSVLLWDRTRLRLGAHVAEINAVAVAPDNRTVLSASLDGTVVVWDAARRTPRRVLANDGVPVADASFSSDGRSIAGVAPNGTLTVWDAVSGRALHTFSTRGGRIKSVAHQPDGALVATGGDDGTVRLWDPRAVHAPEIARLANHQATVETVTFSADGRRLFSASRDGVITIWEVPSRRIVKVLRGNPGLLHAALSRDAGWLAVGQSDGTTTLWDTALGRQVAWLARHAGPVTAAAFSPDGHRLATGSLDRTVMLWNVEERTVEASLPGAGGVTALAWSQDGAVVYAGSADHTITPWILDPLAAEQRICDHLATGFTGSPPSRCSEVTQPEIVR